MKQSVGLLLAMLLLGAAPVRESGAFDWASLVTSPDWWVAGFTGALFFATLGLWIATWKMWRATQSAVVDANAGLTIARDTLSHARESSERQLRAYLAIRPNPDKAVISAGRMPELEIVITNVGQTPAHEITIGGKCSVLEAKPISWAFDIPAEYRTTTVLNPTSFMQTVVFRPEPLSPSEMEEIMASKTALIFEGAVVFRDAFKHPRKAGFRFGYSGIDGVGKPIISVLLEGNEAD